MTDVVDVLTVDGVIQVGAIGLAVGLGLGLLTHVLQSVLDIFKNIIKR